MPAFTYLSDADVRAWKQIPDDKDFNDLLQEFRALTGENWLVGGYRAQITEPGLIGRFLGVKPKFKTVWTLYADCHGEWQVINLVTPRGGSNFHMSSQSREDIMNFILGYIAGIHHARKVQP